MCMVDYWFNGCWCILQDKVKAARDMIAKLRRQKSSLVKCIELLCDAYIDLAYYDVSAQKKQRGPVKLPASCPLLKVKGGVVVPTKDLAVDRTSAYSDVTCIDRFEPYFQLAGGVNLPKIVTCVGSDGKRRKQLVKVSTTANSQLLVHVSVHNACTVSNFSMQCYKKNLQLQFCSHEVEGSSISLWLHMQPNELLQGLRNSCSV